MTTSVCQEMFLLRMRFRFMKKMKLPDDAIKGRMTIDGISLYDIEEFFNGYGDPNQSVVKLELSSAVPKRERIAKSVGG